jgi:hypothetical protein
MTFPVVGPADKPHEWPLFADRIVDYQVCYPGIDAQAEALRARQWCIDNATRRKTFSGMPRFLNSWMARAQDDSGKRLRTDFARNGGGNSGRSMLEREIEREEHQLAAILGAGHQNAALHAGGIQETNFNSVGRQTNGSVHAAAGADLASNAQHFRH